MKNLIFSIVITFAFIFICFIVAIIANIMYTGQDEFWGMPYIPIVVLVLFGSYGIKELYDKLNEK